MGSNVPRVFFTTRQRLESSDGNHISDLMAKAIVLAELADGCGDEYLLGTVGRTGVVAGFLVRSLPGTNLIEISPGLGLVQEVPAAPTYDPPSKWIQLDAPVQIDLTAYVDPTQPRLLTIEIGPSDATIVSSPIEIFDGENGQFGFLPSAPRVIGAVPVWNVRAGTPAASPVVATGAAGWLPLAIVKLTAAQAGFGDEFASVLMCRPLLGQRDSKVSGGGVSVGEVSGGALINLTDLYLTRCSATLAGLHAEASGRILFATLGRTPASTSPGDIIADPQAAYGYLAPPPWGGDYPNCAPREAWQRNPNEVPYATAGNIVGGAGPTFISLASETPSSPGATLRNAIVIWDIVAPSGLERGAGAAPLQVIDSRAPHPATAPGGAGSLTLAASQDPSWGASQVIYETVYLGAVASLGTVDFMGQAVGAAGAVTVIDALDLVLKTGRRPLRSDTADTGLVDLFPGQYPNMGKGGVTVDVLPTTADIVTVGLVLATGSGGGNSGVILNEKFGYGLPDPVPIGGLRTIINNTQATSFASDSFQTMRRNPSGALSIWAIVAGGTAGYSLDVYLRGYTDTVLAAR